MIHAGNNIKIETLFYNEKIRAALDRKTRKTLMILGADYRKVVRRSMRPGGKKNKSSRKGRPPRWHTKALRDGILFAYDAKRETVVVGARANNSGKSNAHILEQGGRTVVEQFEYPRNWNAKAPDYSKLKRIKKQISIAPRPYVGENSDNFKYAVKKLKELTESVEFK